MTIAMRETQGRARPYRAQSATRVTTGQIQDGARRKEMRVKSSVPAMDPTMSQR